MKPTMTLSVHTDFRHNYWAQCRVDDMYFHGQHRKDTEAAMRDYPRLVKRAMAALCLTKKAVK